MSKCGGGLADAAWAVLHGKDGHMRFAIPMAQGKLSLHFGHCESFAIMDVSDGEIVRRDNAQAPGYAPGLLPKWLAERGADVIIAGGMGQRAQALFAQHGIEVAIGAAREEPEELVKSYVLGTLATGENICDH